MRWGSRYVFFFKNNTTKIISTNKYLTPSIYIVLGQHAITQNWNENFYRILPVGFFHKKNITQEPNFYHRLVCFWVNENIWRKKKVVKKSYLKREGILIEPKIRLHSTRWKVLIANQIFIKKTHSRRRELIYLSIHICTSIGTYYIPIYTYIYTYTRILKCDLFRENCSNLHSRYLQKCNYLRIICTFFIYEFRQSGLVKNSSSSCESPDTFGQNSTRFM